MSSPKEALEQAFKTFREAPRTEEAYDNLTVQILKAVEDTVAQFKTQSLLNSSPLVGMEGKKAGDE